MEGRFPWSLIIVLLSSSQKRGRRIKPEGTAEWQSFRAGSAPLLPPPCNVDTSRKPRSRPPVVLSQLRLTLQPEPYLCFKSTSSTSHARPGAICLAHCCARTQYKLSLCVVTMCGSFVMNETTNDSKVLPDSGEPGIVFTQTSWPHLSSSLRS